MSLEGGDARKITISPGADDSPLYSPDGKYLAFRSQPRSRSSVIVGVGVALEASKVRGEGPASSERGMDRLIAAMHRLHVPRSKGRHG